MNSTRLFLRKKKTLDTSTRSVFQLFEAISTFEDGEWVLSANLQKKKKKKTKVKKKKKKTHGWCYDEKCFHSFFGTHNIFNPKSGLDYNKNPLTFAFTSTNTNNFFEPICDEIEEILYLKYIRAS